MTSHVGLPLRIVKRAPPTSARRASRDTDRTALAGVRNARVRPVSRTSSAGRARDAISIRMRCCATAAPRPLERDAPPAPSPAV